MKQWTITDLKEELQSRSEIRFWSINHRNTEKRERYLMKNGSERTALIDQDRSVDAETVEVFIAIENGKEGRQGEMQKRLFKMVSLKEQVDALQKSAKQTDHQIWDLPGEVPQDVPIVMSSDPAITEDLDQSMESLTHTVSEEVGKKRETQFNSSEVFLYSIQNELHLSNGLVHRWPESRVYMESAFSYEAKDEKGEIQSDEYLKTKWSVAREQLNVPRLFSETSDRARKSLDVKMPPSGKVALLVDTEVLAYLFSDFLVHLSSSSQYNDLPYRKVGAPFIEGASGDLIDLKMNPLQSLGASSNAINSFGVPQKELTLVDQNEVRHHMTSKKYGDYLGMSPTTTVGTVVVGEGTRTREDLIQAASQVIEIHQFSALFSDPVSGTFGSEIRLGHYYDHDSGKDYAIKGGSISGSLFEHFKKVYFSKERAVHMDFPAFGKHGGGGISYDGPAYALLFDVPVSS